MKQTTYLIIDDEPLAHRIIEKFAFDFPFLLKVGNCYDAMDAAAFLQQQTVDLLFLDINMPKIKGLDFLRSLPSPPQTIVTTAYKEYALEGYELNVVDYLLKPFSLPRFMQAIQKVDRKETPPQVVNNEENSAATIFVKADRQFHQIDIRNIEYVVAYGNYIKLYVQGKMLVVNETLTNFAASLPESDFLRIHKSYLVAIKKITVIDGNQLTIGGQKLPIGATYRDQVRHLINQ